jgi:hypothetical protein
MNKQGIREQVKALMNRNDFTDALADTFIDQATARIQRTLRIPPMEKTEIYTVTVSSPETLAIPADFLNIKYLYCERTLLEYVDLSKFLTTEDPIGNTPVIYTRLQGALKLKPTPAAGTQIVMIYYGEIPDLVGDTDTSWLSELAPDLLVYGALTFAADYFVDERKASFEERFASIYGELEEQSRLTEMDQSALRIQPAYIDY